MVPSMEDIQNFTKRVSFKCLKIFNRAHGLPFYLSFIPCDLKKDAVLKFIISFVDKNIKIRVCQFNIFKKYFRVPYFKSNIK